MWNFWSIEKSLQSVNGLQSVLNGILIIDDICTVFIAHTYSVPSHFVELEAVENAHLNYGTWQKNVSVLRLYIRL